MLRFNAIVQLTGDHRNVLSIDQPLCIGTEGTDFVLQALEKVPMAGSGSLGSAVNH